MSKVTESHEDGLLRRLREGDQSAFTELYRRWQGRVFRFALHMCGAVHVAEDVTQEVFMHVLRNPAQYDSARGTFPAFVIGIARNLTLKALESGRRLIALPEDEPGSGRALHLSGSADAGGIVEGMARQSNVERVRRAVLSLPENYREVVVLCELQEMSYEDASRILECPVGTVRSRLHRAREILARRMRGEAKFAPATAARCN